jgi:hypothetical protein
MAMASAALSLMNLFNDIYGLFPWRKGIYLPPDKKAAFPLTGLIVFDVAGRGLVVAYFTQVVEQPANCQASGGSSLYSSII